MVSSSNIFALCIATVALSSGVHAEKAVAETYVHCGHGVGVYGPGVYGAGVCGPGVYGYGPGVYGTGVYGPGVYGV
ncbi:hypothetical protein PR002_g21360 [Phytophthora rubi]|uniref:Uncharacterized protein n=1 Tax=Phytophthora rubi TaxID=129364 RepID=A0A6A3J2Y3_9STRA|nr:hypothetical protein PR002_g21360 [Phytophthora rubi]